MKATLSKESLKAMGHLCLKKVRATMGIGSRAKGMDEEYLLIKMEGCMMESGSMTKNKDTEPLSGQMGGSTKEAGTQGSRMEMELHFCQTEKESKASGKWERGLTERVNLL